LGLEIDLTLDELKRINQRPTKNLIAYDYCIKGGEALYDGYPQDAIDFYQKAIKLDPSYAQAFAGLGYTYLSAADDYEFPRYLVGSALKVSNESIILDQNCSEAYYVLGEINKRSVQGNPDNISKAEFALNKAIELNNSDWESYISLGELKRNIGHFEEALDWFKRSAQLYPDNPTTHLSIGSTYSAMGDYSQAELLLKSAIESSPNTAEAYGTLALLYMKQEQYDKALATFKAGIKKDSSHSWLYHDLAVAYKNCGRFDEAITEFELAAQIDPKQKYHYLGLAAVYVEQGDYDKAIKVYQMTQSKFPNSLVTALNYSFALNLKGEEDKARRTLEGFIEKSKIAHIDIDACYTQIAQFYLGNISEGEALNSIRLELLKLKSPVTYSANDYYLGMSCLLNLNGGLNKQPRDTIKAIEYFQKYVSSEKIRGNIEYSSARAELNKLLH